MSLKQFLTNLIHPKKEEIEEEVEVKIEPEETLAIKQLPPNERQRGPVLNDKQRIELVQLIARGIPYNEVILEFYQMHQIRLSRSSIDHYKFSAKWKPLIKKYRQSYIEGLEEIPMFHKHVRLERAEKIYEKAFQKDDMRNSLGAIEHARKEVEEKNQINNFELTLNQYNVMSDDELEVRRNEFLKRIQKKEIADGSGNKE